MPSRELMVREELYCLLNKLKVANLATVKPNGAPHVVPVSFIFSKRKIWFTSKKGSLKCNNILKNNKVALSIIGQEQVILIQGTAAIVGPLERYMSPQLSQAFLRKYSRKRRKNSNSVLVSVKPNATFAGKYGKKQTRVPFQL